MDDTVAFAREMKQSLADIFYQSDLDADHNLTIEDRKGVLWLIEVKAYKLTE